MTTALNLGVAAHMAMLANQPVTAEPAPTEEKWTPEPGIPDRLSCAYSSPYFHGGVSSMIGVDIDEVKVGNVYEYCLSEGWYRLRERSGISGKLFSKNIRPFWRHKPSRQVLKRLRRG
jgi:hypothetical protein